MCRQFEWNTPFYQKANVSTDRYEEDKISNEVQDLLHPYLKFDAALYDYCADLLREKIIEAGPTFQEALVTFKANNIDKRTGITDRR